MPVTIVRGLIVTCTHILCSPLSIAEHRVRRTHRLEKVFRLSANTILHVIERNNRLFVAVKGAVAQEHLARKLRTLRVKGLLQDFGSIDKDGQPDFWIGYRRHKYLVECKNVQKTTRHGEMTVDFMRSRYSKTKSPSTRFYHPDEFHVLAACLYNQTGKWQFRFIPTQRLPRHPRYRSRLDSRISLGPSTRYYRYWQDNLLRALSLVRRRG